MIVRVIVAVIAALLVASLAVRNAAVEAWSETAPRKAVAAWPGDPDGQLSLGMIEIAEAMRDRKAVPETVFSRVDAAALRDPLAAEPFLVHGVRASLAGDYIAAKRNYVAAQKRDPRSLPAAYFLANQYFREGDATRGLDQIALLARLAPAGLKPMGPYLAIYARDRKNWPELRSLFAANPLLGDVALQELAADPTSGPIILSLANARQLSPKANWVGALMTNMIGAGDYAGARALWMKVAHARMAPGALLFDPAFTQDSPPPPFNWDLTASTAGLAERRPGGSLHVMFYGSDDGTLARQLLVLPPGPYRLMTRLQPGASHPEALNWTVRCQNGNQELARLSLDQVAAHGLSFQVPQGCSAQWLELDGSAPELPQQSDVSIANVGLMRGGGGA